LTDRFQPGIEDLAWMSALADEGGWVVLLADPRIHRNRLEGEAWRQSGLVIFFLTSQWRRLRRLEIAWCLLRWRPRIGDQVRIVAPAVTFELPLGYGAGRLRVLRG
jgi:hypothetical protein